MKIAAVTAAACLVALAGCSGMPSALNPQPTAITASGTYYCWQDRLNDGGPDMVCNWQRVLSDACSTKDFSSIPKASVVGEPRKTHRCESGQWLVAVTTR